MKSFKMDLKRDKIQGSEVGLGNEKSFKEVFGNLAELKCVNWALQSHASASQIYKTTNGIMKGVWVGSSFPTPGQSKNASWLDPSF